MVLCFVALFVFAVMGIFSAKYRALTREAFDCVIRTATLRPCESKLDERIKATLIAKVLDRSPKAAGWLHRNFRWISLGFTVLFFVSLAYSAVSVYNYVQYGNCNGPQSTGFCAFDLVFGEGHRPLLALQPGVGPTLGNGSTTIVEVGCFSCPFTRSSQPALKQFLAKHPEVTLEFRALPIPAHANSFISAQAAFCAGDQGKFWPMYDALFNDTNHARDNLVSMAGKLGLDTSKFNACLDSQASKDRVNKDLEAGKAAGIYGTPTFFLNGSILVGPQTENNFEQALAGANLRPEPGGTTNGGTCPPPVQ